MVHRESMIFPTFEEQSSRSASGREMRREINALTQGGEGGEALIYQTRLKISPHLEYRHSTYAREMGFPTFEGGKARW
jgi:hypothetical protein